MYRVGLVLIVGCGFAPSTAQSSGDDATAAPDSSSVTADASVADAEITVDAFVPAMIPIDCKDALAHGITTSGVVMIDPDGTGGQPAYAAYCDMTTAGGGWTLVYVYSFANYPSFQSGSNAVTPRPTWTALTGTATPTSTTIPSSPTTTGALDFSRWAALGTEVLATSSINHWVKCQPGTGSVVTNTAGTLTCQMVKVVAQYCTTTVPSYWNNADPAGVGFYTGTGLLSTYYFYEGLTLTNNWPTHDPCGNNGANQLTNVTSPRGQIYVRRQ